jgi:VWFA-related protein
MMKTPVMKRWRKPWAKAVLVASLVLPLGFMAFADELSGPPPEDSHPYTISTQVGLVVLPVFVTDKRGRPVSGLQQSDFQLYQDGQPRPITLFEPEDVPATIGLVIDNSSSMRSKHAEVAAAGLDFAQSSNPQDQLFIVNFNEWASLGLPEGVPFTNNWQVLESALAKNHAAGNTALYDGIALALQHLKAGTRERKALIVVSDGEDNSSDISLDDLLSRIRGSNVVINTIGLFDPSDRKENPDVLRKLARMTGGNAYFPQSDDGVATACRDIAANIRHAYTLGYTLSNADSGDTYHAIRVIARASGHGDLHVQTRSGFVPGS